MPPNNLRELVSIFIDLIQVALPVVVGFALIAFFWGLAKFIFRVGGDETAVNDGKSLMIWGVIALFVMISIWGILRFFYSSLGFSKTFGLPLLP